MEKLLKDHHTPATVSRESGTGDQEPVATAAAAVLLNVPFVTDGQKPGTRH